MALHFTGLDCLSLSLTSPYYATPLYPGLNWNAPYRIASSLHVITIIAPNCIARLQMTVLHCMWMYSSGLDHTAELCTAPDVTWKDCSGLPELQWSWWQYIKLHLTCMQKTANKDWQYNDVLRKDQLNQIVLWSLFQFQLVKTIRVLMIQNVTG